MSSIRFPWEYEHNDEPDEEYASVCECVNLDGKTWYVDMDDDWIYFWDEDDERHGTIIGVYSWVNNCPKHLKDEYKWMLD